MTAERLPGSQGAIRSAAVVRAWVDLYTRGLPKVLRDRRREQVASDLEEEALEAGWTGRESGLTTQRYGRLVRGLPADISWRFIDARAIVRTTEGGRPPMPASRLALALLGLVGVLALAGLAVMLSDLGRSTNPGNWAGWGPYGFIAALVLVLAGVGLAVWRPRAGAAIAVAGALIGVAASPWLWPFWLLVPYVVGFRLVRPLPDRADSPAL